MLHVAVDNLAAARVAVDHLIDRGRRRIAAVGAELRTDTMGPAVRRTQGYRLALAAAGIEARAELEVSTERWSRPSGYAAVRALLAGGTDVDALFCFNDVLALAAVRAITDHGLRVPADIAVVGWDDTAEAAYSVPSLTSISPDKAEIASTAVDRLVALIGGEPVGPAEVASGFRLVVRESSA